MVIQYVPTKKHELNGFSSLNPIKNKQEGQMLLETGFKYGKQIYNVTEDGKIVKFQPDNTPNNGYHSYEISEPKDLPSKVIKQLELAGKISKVKSNKLRKGKVKVNKNVNRK